MMSGKRASIFGNDDEPDFDVSDFAPAGREDRPAPPAREDVAAVSDAAGFRRREPSPAPPSPVQPGRRVWRTGRNVQFNVKATPETIERFKAISDANEWPLAVTLERAVAALERELLENDKGRG